MYNINKNSQSYKTSRNYIVTDLLSVNDEIRLRLLDDTDKYVYPVKIIHISGYESGPIYYGHIYCEDSDNKVQFNAGCIIGINTGINSAKWLPYLS